MKGIFAIVAAGAIAATGMAQADPCMDTIVGLYDDGPLDSFAQPPYLAVSAQYLADGTLKQVTDMIVETPTRIVSGVRGSGQFLLAIDLETWIGTTPTGPWTFGGRMQHDDAGAAQQAVIDDEQQNVATPECLGQVDLDGKPHMAYRFFTKTLPHPDRGNSWFGGQKTVYVDMATNLITRLEMTAQVASWAAVPSTDKQVTVYTYDPSIKLERPAD